MNNSAPSLSRLVHDAIQAEQKRIADMPEGLRIWNEEQGIAWQNGMSNGRRIAQQVIQHWLTAQELTPEGVDTMVEAAAQAMFENPDAPGDYTWAQMVTEDPSRADLWRQDARRVLVAAGVLHPRFLSASEDDPTGTAWLKQKIERIRMAPLTTEEEALLAATPQQLHGYMQAAVPTDPDQQEGLETAWEQYRAEHGYATVPTSADAGADFGAGYERGYAAARTAASEVPEDLHRALPRDVLTRLLAVAEGDLVPNSGGAASFQEDVAALRAALRPGPVPSVEDVRTVIESAIWEWLTDRNATVTALAGPLEETIRALYVPPVLAAFPDFVQAALPTERPQVPSDAQVLAALNSQVRPDRRAPDLSYWGKQSTDVMRAALVAAQGVDQ